MKKIIKNPYILSILAYLAIMYQLDMFNTNGFKFMYLLGFIGILVVFKNFDFEKVEKRLKIYSLSTSTIFSILLIIGRTVMKYEFNPMSNLFTLKSILFNIIFIICLIPFLYVCFIYLIRFIGNIKLSKTKSIKSKKFALISFIIMCLGKIPYLLAFFPALMTIDSFNVINLYESGTLFNNHPIVYTYFFGTIYKIGKIIFGSGTLGIFFFTIFQVVVIAIILTWLLNYLNNKGVNKYIIYLLLLYYSFSPDFGYMSMTLWKDVLFGISFIPFILSITKMAESDVVNKKINIKYIIIFILSSFAILFFR